LFLIGVILRAPYFIAIAIAIAIENPPTRSISSKFAKKGESFARIPVALNIIPHRITPTPKLRQHRCYAIEDPFRDIVLLRLNRATNLKHVLDRGAFKCRTTSDLEEPAAVSI